MKKILSVLLSILMLSGVIAGLDFQAVAAGEYEKYFEPYYEEDEDDYDDDDTDYTRYTSGDYEYYIQNDGTAAIVAYNGDSKYITIPSALAGHTVSCIRNDAFEFSDVISITIPKTVTEIQREALVCYNLSIITVDEGNPVFSSKNGVLYNKDQTKLIRFPQDKGIEFTMPSTVLSVGEYAFAYSDIYSITFNNTIKEICRNAFYRCNDLEKLVLPESITEIGSCAFAECEGLEKVTINSAIKKINYETFSECESLNEVNLPDGIVYIDDSAFEDTALYDNSRNWSNGNLYIGNYWIATNKEFSGSYTIKAGTKTIPSNAFKKCFDLENVTIPSSVIGIGDGAFEYCTSLKSITLPSGLEYLDSLAFKHCFGLKSINIPDGITDIYYDTFFDCSALTQVTGCKNVKQIHDEAFYGCSSLTSLSIGNKLEVLGEKALQGCTALKSITLPASLNNLGDYNFIACESLANINVAAGNKAFKSIDGVLYTADGKVLLTYPCSKTGEVFTTPSSVTGIGKSAFDNCKYLKRLILSSNVNRLGCNAIYNNWELYSIKILNPNCQFYDNSDTIHNKWLDECYVCGYKNSTTQKFYKEYKDFCDEYDFEMDLNFVCIDDYNCGKSKHSYLTDYYEAATLAEDGEAKYTCVLCGNGKIDTIPHPDKLTLSQTSYTYDSKKKKPTVTVKDSSGNTISSANYTVSYASGRKNVGKYKVTVKFKNDYEGTVDLYFTINPKNTSLSKLTAKSKGFTAKWKKYTTQTTGYQLQYSTSSKFSNAKTVTISKNKTTSKSIKKLKGKKKYYVRIRTYKTVSGTKYYSSWSKAKSIKTKK